MIQSLTPGIILSLIASYFLLLLVISYFTGKNDSNEAFFLADRNSPWFVVAFGMIGASLSGVTFISIPGAVGATPDLMQSLTGEAKLRPNIQFSYLQMVFGYLAGYAFIALVLLPVYYKLKLTSIYEYLQQRFGDRSYKTGAFFFLLSRSLGAGLRLFLVAIVLDKFVLGRPPFNVPFEFTVLITILLIWVYTFRGGIKTIIWTDTLQTVFMLTAVIFTIFAIGSEMELSLGGLVQKIQRSDLSQVFFFEGGWSDPNNFFKQFISGALITIVMTGLDQDMMQKNLSCRNLGDAQKNMFTFSGILVFANLLFISLGALLYIYGGTIGVAPPLKAETGAVITDEFYPLLALDHLSPFIGIMFVLGLIAAAYSSADSALTSLTTSFCVDFLGFGKKDRDKKTQRRLRLRVHLGFSALLFLLILLFNATYSDAVINVLFKVAGFTYGPLLGLFAFGLFTSYQIDDKKALWVCIIAPVLAILLDAFSDLLLFGFKLGFLVLAVTGLFTFIGLMLIRESE